jgi:hypothetical protein
MFDRPAGCVVCETIIKLALAQTSQRPSGCQLLDSAPKEARFRKPKWRTVSVQEHIALVKMVIALQVTGWRPGVWEDQGSPRGNDAYLTEVFWRRYGDQIAPLLESDAVRLETTEFDADHDGERDVLYRLTEIQPVDPKKPRDWRVGRCDPQTTSYSLFADPKDSPELAVFFRSQDYHVADVFIFDGLPYFWDTAVHSSADVWQIRRSNFDKRPYRQRIFEATFMPTR